MQRPTASLMLNLFDGDRRPLSAAWRVLIRLRDGLGRTVSAKYHRAPSICFLRLPCYDNFRDNYTVVASAPGRMTSGQTGVRLRPGAVASLDLMLPLREAAFNFGPARWDALAGSRPRWAELLEHERYEALIEQSPGAAAGLLNLLTALEQTPLGEGAALDYFTELIWDPPPAPDRFFAWARAELLDRMAAAVQAGVFAVSLLPGLLHPGATASFRETRLPAANLQLTFHARERRQIRGLECVKIEPDMDYYRDPAAHGLLEVLPNHLLNRKTDPRTVYMLRWMATRRSGAPEFTPPYTLG